MYSNYLFAWQFTFNCWQQQHITFIPCLLSSFLLSTIMLRKYKKKYLKSNTRKLNTLAKHKKTWKSKRSSIKMQTYAPRSPPMYITRFIPLQVRTTTVNPSLWNIKKSISSFLCRVLLRCESWRKEEGTTETKLLTSCSVLSYLSMEIFFFFYQQKFSINSNNDQTNVDQLQCWPATAYAVGKYSVFLNTFFSFFSFCLLPFFSFFIVFTTITTIRRRACYLFLCFYCFI